MRKFSIILFIFFFMIIACTGCRTETTEYTDNSVDVDTLSREYISDSCQHPTFGYSMSDDCKTAINYIYNNSELCELYGEDFEISNYSGSSGSEGYGPSIFNKLEATVYVEIDGKNYWCVKLQKTPLSKWEVTDYYQRKEIAEGMCEHCGINPISSGMYVILTDGALNVCNECYCSYGITWFEDDVYKTGEGQNG